MQTQFGWFGGCSCRLFKQAAISYCFTLFVGFSRRHCLNETYYFPCNRGYSNLTKWVEHPSCFLLRGSVEISAEGQLVARLSRVTLRYVASEQPEPDGMLTHHLFRTHTYTQTGSPFGRHEFCEFPHNRQTHSLPLAPLANRSFVLQG